jgi:serine/threonine protein kinase
MNPGEPLATRHLLDGRYRIKKVLGAGGMGRVYLANDTRLANRPVAVKEMMIGDGVKEKKAIEDFAREARVLALLSHPGIPNLIDYFVENGRHYLVMEFVAGGNLQSMVEELGPGGKLPEAQVLRWSRQILEVLDFLHGQDPPIIYRDLKPANIMIDKAGRAMLIDFGIARFLPRGGRGTQIGSVGYAPPEQYMGKVEPRSDLYSLAATMHHLLTGRDPQLEPPFSFPPVRQLNPAVSKQTAAAVARALDKDVAKRPSSAGEMLAALPEPPPATDNAGAVALGAPLSPPPAIGMMKTVVLPPRAPAPPKPAVSPPSQPDRGSPAISRMETIVLSNPVPQPSPPPAARRSATGPTKVRELKEKALALLSRRLKTGLGVLTAGAPPPRVSSTSKTQELNNRPKPSAPVRLAASAATAPRPASGSTSGRAAHGTPKAQARGAKLVSRADGREFPIVGARVIIGRSGNPEEALDVDLNVLKQGRERVSHRHAEVVTRGADYYIRDLGSLNGTYIVGLGRLGRDQLYKLKDRDQVVLGNAIFQFRKS